MVEQLAVTLVWHRVARETADRSVFPQEMGIVVLGHQKKLMLAINHIVQTLRRTQPPVRANAPPTVRPKPTASATKSPARNKSLTPFHEPPAGEQARASFQVPPTKISNAAKPPPREKATAPPQEPSGASSELLRALNRRQKIIDDAEETRVPQPESGATSQLPQNEHVAPQPSANDVTKQVSWWPCWVSTICICEHTLWWRIEPGLPDPLSTRIPNFDQVSDQVSTPSEVRRG